MKFEVLLYFRVCAVDLVKSEGAPESALGSIFDYPLFFWSFSFGEAKEKRIDEDDLLMKDESAMA